MNVMNEFIRDLFDYPIWRSISVWVVLVAAPIGYLFKIKQVALRLIVGSSCIVMLALIGIGDHFLGVGNKFFETLRLVTNWDQAVRLLMLIVLIPPTNVAIVVIGYMILSRSITLKMLWMTELVFALHYIFLLFWYEADQLPHW